MDPRRDRLPTETEAGDCACHTLRCSAGRLLAAAGKPGTRKLSGQSAAADFFHLQLRGAGAFGEGSELGGLPARADRDAPLDYRAAGPGKTAEDDNGGRTIGNCRRARCPSDNGEFRGRSPDRPGGLRNPGPSPVKTEGFRSSAEPCPQSGERDELARRRTLLEAKLSVLQRGGWGFHAPHGAEPLDVVGLEEKLAGIEQQLLGLGGDDNLEVYLELVIDVLSRPEEHLWYRKENVIADGMGIKRNEVTSEAPAVTLETIGNDLGLNLVVSLVAIPGDGRNRQVG